MMAPPMPVGHVHEQSWFADLMNHLEQTGAFWLYALAIFGLMIMPMLYCLPVEIGGRYYSPQARAEVFGIRYGTFTMGLWALVAAIHLS